MTSLHDGSFAFRSGNGAASALASAARALRGLSQTGARLWLARAMAHAGTAAESMVLLDAMPGILVGESAEAHNG